MSTITSNYIGKPPLNSDDWWLAKSFAPKSKFPFNPNGTWPATAPARQNVPDRGWLMILRGSLLIFVATSLTVLRLYIRGTIGKKRGSGFGLDDYFICAALLWFVAWAVLDMELVINGCFGKHIQDCTYKDLGNISRWAQSSSLAIWPFFALVKVSILLFYRRLGFFTNRFYPTIIYTTMFLSASWGLIGMFMFAFRCNPVRAGYDLVYRSQNVAHVKCFPPGLLTSGVSWGHVALDIIIIAIPLSVVWRLQMSTKTKLQLSVVFSVAFLSVIASIVRSFDGHPVDSTWEGVHSRVVIWGGIDATTAIVVANLPALNQLFLDKKKNFSFLHPRLHPLWHSLASTFNRSRSHHSSRSSDKSPRRSNEEHRHSDEKEVSVSVKEQASLKEGEKGHSNV